MRVYWMGDHKCALQRSKYCDNGHIALVLCTLNQENNPDGGVYGIVTVNLEQTDYLPEDEAYVNDGAIGVDYYDWLIRKGLAKPVSKRAHSRYRTYHAVKLCQDIMDLKEGEYL